MEQFSLANQHGPDLLLVNPAAGGGRASASLPGLRKFAGQRGWNVEICVTNSPEDLAAKARNAAEAGRTRIFVLGGDGTFQALLNSIAHFPLVVLAVIPAGGGNDLASALGLPPNPVQAAGLLLEGEICHLDVARIRTADGSERLYTGGGGVGLDAAAARFANGTYRNVRGRMRYLLAAIRALFGFRAVRVRIKMSPGDATPLEASFLLAGVLNTPSYGGGLCLAPHAKTDDGSLELVLVEDLNLLQILALLPALASRGELRTHRVRRFSTKCVRIETEPPCWFHGDGELLGMTPVEISVMPRAVRVLRASQRSAG